MGEPTVSHRYKFFTYKDVWEKTKKKYNISDNELRKEVEEALQMWAWSDIITESVEFHLNNKIKEVGSKEESPK